MKTIRFTVTGPGDFPLDMLRWDACHPYSQQDVSRIEHISYDSFDRRINREIELVHTYDHDSWKPTDGRWQSFGWNVTEVQS